MTQRRKAPPTHPRRGMHRVRLLCAVLSGLFAGGNVLHAQTGPQRAPSDRTTGHSPALKSRAPVTVNFVNADVEAVTRAMATMIERQIFVDPRVKGTITVYSEQPLSVREAYLNYLAALRGLGFAMVENGGLLKVVPEADAKLQSGTVSVGDVKMRGDQIITQIFPLNHENPNNLVAVLRPLISANNTINASLGNNSLVITDYADNLQRIAKIIAALDQPSASDIEVIPLQHAVASDLAATGAAPVRKWQRPDAAGPAGHRRQRVGDGRPAQQRAHHPGQQRRQARVAAFDHRAAGPPHAGRQRNGQHLGGAPEERRRGEAGRGAARRVRDRRRRCRGAGGRGGAATRRSGCGRVGGRARLQRHPRPRRYRPAQGRPPAASSRPTRRPTR